MIRKKLNCFTISFSKGQALHSILKCKILIVPTLKNVKNLQHVAIGWNDGELSERESYIILFKLNMTDLKVSNIYKARMQRHYHFIMKHKKVPVVSRDDKDIGIKPVKVIDYSHLLPKNKFDISSKVLV